jgi:hypothetical protein
VRVIVQHPGNSSGRKFEHFRNVVDGIPFCLLFFHITGMGRERGPRISRYAKINFILTSFPLKVNHDDPVLLSHPPAKPEIGFI